MSSENVKTRIIAWMEKYGVTAARVAKAIGYTGGAFSRYLTGNYPANPRHIENAIIGFLKNNEGLDDDDIAFRETGSSRKLWGCIQYALDEREIVAAIGPAGIGKTRSIKHLKMRLEDKNRKDQRELILLTPSALMSGPQLARVLGQEMGIGTSIRGHLLLQEISKLLKRDRAVIVDEADQLSLKALECLRWLHDMSECPLVLVGNDILLQKIRGASSPDEFGRIASRIAYVEVLPGLTQKEARELIAEYLGEQPELLVKNILAISGHPKVINFRRVVKLVPLLRVSMEIAGKDEIDEAMIQHAARQLAA